MFYNYLSNNFEINFSDIKDAGGDIKIDFDDNGYVISISLFSDLVDKFMERLTLTIFNAHLDESTFHEVLQSSIEELKGKTDQQPYVKAQDYFKRLVKYMVISNNEMLDYSKNITYATFNQTLTNIISSFSVNSLFYGYLKKDNLNKIISKIQPHINNVTINTFTLIDYLHSHKVIEEPVIFYKINDLPSEHNHVVHNYFQVGLRDSKTSLVMNIINMVWGNMFYYYLRTVKQLGYIVSANKEFIDNYMVAKNIYYSILHL